MSHTPPSTWVAESQAKRLKSAAEDADDSFMHSISQNEPTLLPHWLFDDAVMDVLQEHLPSVSATRLNMTHHKKRAETRYYDEGCAPRVKAWMKKTKRAVQDIHCTRGETFVVNVDTQDVSKLLCVLSGAADLIVRSLPVNQECLELVKCTALEVPVTLYDDKCTHADWFAETPAPHIVAIKHYEDEVALRTRKTLTLDHLPALTTIGKRAFESMSELKTLTLNLPALTTIGEKAFFSMNKLTTLTLNLPALTTIGSAVFRSMDKLTTLTLNLPALTTIGVCAFRSMDVLTTLTLDLPNLTTIGAGAFGSMEALTTLTLDLPKLTTIGRATFYHMNSLTELKLCDLEHLETIDVSAFHEMKALTTLTLCNLPNLTRIGNGAFGGNLNALTTLTLVNLPRLATFASYPFPNMSAHRTLNLSGLPERFMNP